MRLIIAAVAVALTAAVTTSCSNDRVGLEPGQRPDVAQTWRQLPAAPLSPRDHAVVVGVGERMLVVGGWKFLCPPMADCSSPEEPLLDDGAVYDRIADSWQTIEPPPFGVRRQEYATAALDDSAYLLTSCADGPTCAAQARVLSYDLAADHWTDHGPVPGPGRYPHLATIGRMLLVYSGSDEHGEVADQLFDPERTTWTELPDDPLPRTFDRFIAPARGQLVLTGSSVASVDSGEQSPTIAARLDLATREWVGLPDAPGQGYQLFPTGRGPLLNGHFIESPGWMLDPDTWTWTELPDHAGDQLDLSGVLDRDGASYDIPNSVGEVAATSRLLIHDSASGTLVAIPPPPGREDVYDDSSTALGRDLFVFGGQRWPDGSAGDGHLVADAQLWVAPDLRG